MPKFRLKLDLSEFFSDERKYAFILLNPEWDSVKSLEKHVEKVFELENVKFVTDDACLLPSMESVEIVKQEDVLKVIRPGADDDTTIKKKKKKKKKHENISDGHESDFQPNTAGKRKIPENQLSYSTPNVAKKFRTRCSEVTPDTNHSSKELFGISAIATDDSRVHVKKLKNIFESASVLDVNSVTKPENVSEIQMSMSIADDTDPEATLTCVPSKRKRKRKNKLSKLNDSLPADSMLEVAKVVKNGKKRSKNENHIRFDADSTEETPKARSLIELVNICDSYDPIIPRIIHAQVIFEPNNNESKKGDTIHTDYENNSSIISLNNTTIKNALIIDEDVIELNGTVVEKSPKRTSNSLTMDEDVMEINGTYEEKSRSGSKSETLNCKTSKGATIDKDVMEVNETYVEKSLADTLNLNYANVLELAETLDREPVIGEVILFKILRISENGPGVSGYICGKVNDYNDDDGKFQIYILDGHSETTNDLGKFSCNVSDEETESREEFFYVKYCDMMDKRLFRMPGS